MQEQTRKASEREPVNIGNGESVEFLVDPTANSFSPSFFPSLPFLLTTLTRRHLQSEKLSVSKLFPFLARRKYHIKSLINESYLTFLPFFFILFSKKDGWMDGNFYFDVFHDLLLSFI